MTVQELMAKLAKCDPNATVTIDFAYTSGDYGWTSKEEEESEILEILADDCSKEIHFSTYHQDAPTSARCRVPVNC